MPSARRRLDAELVRRGLQPSRERARSAIEAGKVTVNGAFAAKAAMRVQAGDAIELIGPPPRHVSRAGEKLDAALKAFAVDPRGWRVIDVGSSTGGFTDCLLQHGAAEVVAVDVGRGQLHEKLRADARVEVRERTDVRHLDLPPADLVTVDLSFIGLAAVFGDLARLAKSDLIVLVKPQFEAGRAVVSKGKGVVRDPDVWLDVLVDVQRSALAHGLGAVGGLVSPLRGAAGNVEFLLHLRKGASGGGVNLESLLDDAQHLA